MNNSEKIKALSDLIKDRFMNSDEVFKVLEKIDAIKFHYYDYMITEPINCDEELKRLPTADYDMCCALITMLLREDHFDNGAFLQRCENNDVAPILLRMIEFLR